MAPQRPVSAPPLRQPRHGSRQIPEPSSFTSGAGVFRAFPKNSKFLVDDPLKHQGPPAKEIYSLGQNKSSGGKFRTLDISRINEGRNKWNRIDTFQTPMGHLGGDIEDLPPSRNQACGFQPMLLQALEADLFEEFHSCLETLGTHIVGGLGEHLQSLSREITDSLDQIRAEKKSMQTEALTPGSEEGIAASSHEAHHSDSCKAGPDVNMGDVLQEVRASSLAVLESLKQIRLEGIPSIEAKAGGNVASVGAELPSVLEEIRSVARDVKAESSALSPSVDLSPVLDEIRQLEAIDLSPILVALREMSRSHEEAIRNAMLSSQAAFQSSTFTGAGEELPQPKVDIDLTQVLQAFDEHASSMVKMLQEIEKEHRDPALAAPINEKRSSASEVDFSEVLEALEEHTKRLEHTRREDRSGASHDLSPVIELLGEQTRRLEDHIASSRKAFSDISRTVLQEVRGGWVEVASLWSIGGAGNQASPGRVEMSSSHASEANLTALLKPLEEHAAASLAAVEDVCRNARDAICEMKKTSINNADAATHKSQSPDFSEVLKAIREMQSQVDLSEVHKAMDKVRTDMKLELADLRPLLLRADSGTTDTALRASHDAPPLELAGGAEHVVLSHIYGSTEELQKKMSGLEERLLSKVSSEHKLAMIELHKILALLDGIMDMSSSQADLSPVLDAISRLAVPSEVNFNSVFRTITEISSSIAAAQTQLSQAGKLPTEDDLINLRQVVLGKIADVAVNCEQLQGKVDNLEEHLISRMNSNHKVAMSELQKGNNAQAT